MAIVWNETSEKFEYDNRADDGSKNEADFKINLLNALEDISSNLNNIANAIFRIGNKVD